MIVTKTKKNLVTKFSFGIKTSRKRDQKNKKRKWKQKNKFKHQNLHLVQTQRN